MSALDLATPPELLLPIGLVLCSISALLLLHEHRSAVARARRRVRAWLDASRTDARLDRGRAVRAGARAVRRGARARAVRQRRDAASARRRMRAAVRPEHHRLLDLHQQVALTDDELLALARWIDRQARDSERAAIGYVLDKIERAASDIIYADRATRR